MTTLINLYDINPPPMVELKDYGGVMLPKYVDGREVLCYPNAGFCKPQFMEDIIWAAVDYWTEFNHEGHWGNQEWYGGWDDADGGDGLQHDAIWISRIDAKLEITNHVDGEIIM